MTVTICFYESRISCALNKLNSLNKCQYTATFGTQKLIRLFDCVWHHGLFVKLYNMGIRSNLLRVTINLHKDMKSAVFYERYHSPWFSVMQGTRQGRVSSPFLNFCLINDLWFQAEY